MYKQFFGLSQGPFNSTLDTRFFFEGPQHAEALASLVYAVDERKGLVVVTGDVGCGKSLVGHMLTERLGNRAEVARLNSTHLRCGPDLLQNVCREFQLPVDGSYSTMELLAALEEFMLTQHAKKRPSVLVIDDIQVLEDAHLDQLRLLANLEVSGGKLLQIVLMGQRDLHGCLSGPAGKPLRQRVFRSFNLAPFTRPLTERYIRHRLSTAGCNEVPFTADALDIIHKYANGIPRLINNLCDNVMLSAFAAETRSIDAAGVRSVIDEMASLDAGARRHEIAGDDEADAIGEITSQYARRLESQISELEAVSSHTDERIAALERLSTRLQAQEQRLTEQQESLQTQALGMDKAVATLEQQEVALRKREQALSARMAELTGFGDRISEQNRTIAEREARMSEQQRELERLSELLVAHDQRLEEKAGFLDKKLTNRQVAFDRELNECKRVVNRKWDEMKQMVVEHVARETDWSKRLASIDLRLRKFESLAPDLERIQTRLTTTATTVQAELTNRVAELTKTITDHEARILSSAQRIHAELAQESAGLGNQRQESRKILDEHERLQRDQEQRLARIRETAASELTQLNEHVSRRMAEIETTLSTSAERYTADIRSTREQLDSVVASARQVMQQPQDLLDRAGQQMEQVHRLTAMVQKATGSLQRTIDVSIKESKTLHDNARGIREQLDESADEAAQVLSDLTKHSGKTHQLRDVLREIYQRSARQVEALEGKIKEAESTLARLPKQWEELREHAAHPAQLMKELRSVGSTTERNIHEGVVQLTELRRMIEKADRTRRSIEALITATRRVADVRRPAVTEEPDRAGHAALTQKIAHLQDAVRKVRNGAGERGSTEVPLGAS